MASFKTYIPLCMEPKNLYCFFLKLNNCKQFFVSYHPVLKEETSLPSFCIWWQEMFISLFICSLTRSLNSEKKLSLGIVFRYTETEDWNLAFKKFMETKGEQLWLSVINEMSDISHENSSEWHSIQPMWGYVFAWGRDKMKDGFLEEMGDL